VKRAESTVAVEKFQVCWHPLLALAELILQAARAQRTARRMKVRTAKQAAMLGLRSS
jgi:hypothetical protein